MQLPPLIHGLLKQGFGVIVVVVVVVVVGIGMHLYPQLV